MATMAGTGPDLPALYNSREYADCTLVSSEGEEFQAHRLVVAQHGRFKDLIARAEPDRRVEMTESRPVVVKMLEWMYGIEWNDGAGISTADELVVLMGVRDAAEKV